MSEVRAVDISMTSDISPHFPRDARRSSSTSLQQARQHYNILGGKVNCTMSSNTTYPVLPRDESLSQLPDEYPDNAQGQIARILTTTSPNRLVVLDDDPTGTQTSHDISVLTVWDLPTLIAEFDELSSPGPCRAVSRIPGI